MPILTEKLRNLQESFKELDNGKVVSYFSKSMEDVEGVKSFYEAKYHILGPTFLEKEEKYVISFIYDKKKVIVPEGHPNA